MGNLTSRDQLILQLKPKLRPTWNLIKYERNVDEITGVTLLVRQRSVSRMPEAPQGYYVTQFVLSLIVPQEDRDLAEDALDDALLELLLILDQINPNLWESNQKALDATTNRLAYDVTVNLYTTKE